MRKRELERLLCEWQEALGLRDWEIELEIVPGAKLSRRYAGAPVHGEIEYVTQQRCATINIAKDSPDQELTIVHELLHCWTAPIREARREELVEEQAVEAVSKALVNLKRQAHNSR